MDLENPPDLYWHCLVEVTGTKGTSIVNDMNFEQVRKSVVDRWLAGRPFTVSGTIVRSPETVNKIKIVYTPEPQQPYASRHGAEVRASGIADMATNRRLLPFSAGEDVTFQLLFEGPTQGQVAPDDSLVEQVCRRLPQAARVLASRSRAGRAPFMTQDEYDVQDLLHALLRAYLKYSVQEDPLPKVAGVKAGRADLAIEELGTLIEVKYLRGPQDQKRLFEEFSQDLVLYARWSPLRTLIFLVFNSGDLRDAEALEKLGGDHEVSGRRFDVRIVLA
jgi:hypothetical protein